MSDQGVESFTPVTLQVQALVPLPPALAPPAPAPPPPLPTCIGPCALGSDCTAKNQELSDQYRCRLCNKQLHGFISGCSQAKNPKDFRDGVICKEQPCFDGEAVPVLKELGRADGAVSFLFPIHRWYLLVL